MNKLHSRLVIFALLMNRILQFIIALVLVLAAWHVTGNAAAEASLAAETPAVTGFSAADKVHAGGETAAISFPHVTSVPSLPALPDAELATSSVQFSLQTFLRGKRLSETISLLQACTDCLAWHATTLSLHCEKLYHTTTSYQCSPVCSYYIFALRRILI